MNRHVKCALLAGAAWGVLAGATVAQDAEATAQAANAQDAATVDDIVVTGTLRSVVWLLGPMVIAAVLAFVPVRSRERAPA